MGHLAATAGWSGSGPHECVIKPWRSCQYSWPPAALKLLAALAMPPQRGTRVCRQPGTPALRDVSPDHPSRCDEVFSECGFLSHGDACLNVFLSVTVLWGSEKPKKLLLEGMGVVEHFNVMIF